MIEIKEVPGEVRFTENDIVEVNGKLKSGIGKVIMAFYPTKQPTGELSYSLAYDEPFPQIDVLFPDSSKIHYNADDLLEGKIRHTDKEFQEPKMLQEWLCETKVIFEMENPDEEPTTLCNALGDKISFLSPLLSQKCWMIPGDRFLGEFDGTMYTFKSSRVGVMMCDDGVPAWVVELGVHGYDPITLNVHIYTPYSMP